MTTFLISESYQIVLQLSTLSEGNKFWRNK